MKGKGFCMGAGHHFIENLGDNIQELADFQLFGRVTNLFDRDYEESFGYPALGRSAMAGLRVATSR